MPSRGLLIGLLMVAVLAMMTAVTAQQGCKDLQLSWTKWDYYAIRDMRRTVVVNPQ